MGISYFRKLYLNFRSAFLVIIAAGLSVPLISSCAPLSSADQPVQSDFLTLKTGEEISQTFTPRFDGLTEFSIYLDYDGNRPAELEYALTANPSGSAPLVSGILVPDAIAEPGFTSIQFSPLTHSFGKDLLLHIKNSGRSDVKIGLASGSAYLQGAASLNNEPDDIQLTFRTGYAPLFLGVGLVREGFSWAFYVGISTLLFVIPGWALLKLSDHGWQSREWFEKLALSTGASLVIYPILLLWTYLPGVRLGALYAWLPFSLGAGFLVFTFVKQHPKRGLQRQSIRIDWYDIALIVLLGSLIFSRFWAIRTAAVPLFGDSYQHTMITRLMLDHSGLFSDWQPYAELVTFTYHFGFHILAAVFSWMGRLSADQSVLIVGQIINCIAVITLYPIAKKAGASKTAGLVAVIVAGCLSSMPAQYVNWGRYTQLTAQAILPVFAFFYTESLQPKEESRRVAIITGIIMAGLALTHYRIIIFAVLFPLGYHLIHLKESLSKHKLRRITVVAILAIVLSLPWFINAFGGRLIALFNAQITTAPSVVRETFPVINPTGPLNSYLPEYIWWIFGIASVAAILMRRKLGITIIFWWGLIILAANPQWFNLPGAGVITSFAAFIAFYIPASILIGALLGWVEQLISQRIPAGTPAYSKPIILISLMVLALLGASRQARILNPAQFALVTQPDLRAAAWIDANLPADAHITVNSFPAFYNTTIVGSDAGWWLPLLANRSTTLPPITYNFEREPYPGYRQEINALVEILATYGTLSPEYLRALEERNVTHLYIGQRRGSVNYEGPLAFDPSMLLSNPHFIPIYHQDRVWIFEVRP